ncbi:MAG: class I SAM-dependent methyltransferase [Microlunatus sp.]|nr:class I SAM-dependent methyltransferase [Microlunatus sp.]
MSGPTAGVFDEWYDAIGTSSGWDRFVWRWLDLPDGLDSTSYLPGPGFIEVQHRLGLRAGQTLIELGCGRAGYGLAAIRHTGARLVGVDFAAAALRAAEARADQLGLANRAEFRAADLADTDLPDQSAEALLCVDAFHFANSPLGAAEECLRLLKPAVKVVITTWEPSSQAAAGRLPAWISRMDVARDLHTAGFVDIDAARRPSWSQTEIALWTAASAIDPGDDSAFSRSATRRWTVHLVVGDDVYQPPSNARERSG